MNNAIIVDINSERDDMVIVSHLERTGDDIKSVGGEYDIVLDMATLCEGICTLMHIAEKEGIKSSIDSLKDCINHLEQGFIDASYKVDLDNDN